MVAGSGQSWGDISPIRVVRIGIGETVQPLQESDVRMVSEDVNITLGDSTASVSCRFEMKNEGIDKTIQLGFPGWPFNYIFDFRAWVEGVEVPVKIFGRNPPGSSERDGVYQFHAGFTAPFVSGGKTVVVETRYKNRLVPNQYWGMKDLGFEYILRTGSFWKGYIDDAKVTVDCGTIPPGRIADISPACYTRSSNTITWRFRNFKPRTPRDDIHAGIIQKKLYSRMGEAFFLLRENPSSARGHYLLGTILFNREDRDLEYKKAEKELLKAVELDPGLLDARFLLAVINCMPKHDMYLERFSIQKAVMQLREIVKRNPDYSFRDWQLTPEIYRYTHMHGSRASEWLNTLAGDVSTEK